MHRVRGIQTARSRNQQVYFASDTVVARGGAWTARSTNTIVKRASRRPSVARTVVTWKVDQNDGTDPVSASSSRLPAAAPVAQATGDHMFNCSQVAGYVSAAAAAAWRRSGRRSPETRDDHVASFAPDTPGVSTGDVDPENLSE
jgi:hypothetical protein